MKTIEAIDCFGHKQHYTEEGWVLANSGTGCKPTKIGETVENFIPLAKKSMPLKAAQPVKKGCGCG